MRRYLWYLVSTVILGQLAIAAILGYRYWIVRDVSDQDISLSQITIYQEAKIEALEPGAVDTVFLGDSSLGNAINVRVFDREIGTRSVNLALTGSYGHAGALVFLRKMLARQPKLKNVILFFSVDAMGWGMNPQGRFFMTASPVEPALNRQDQVKLLLTYLGNLTQGREAAAFAKKIARNKAMIELPPELVRDDYIIAQAKISPQSPDIMRYRFPTVEAVENTPYLKEIGRICRDRKLRCYYAQGPIMKELLTDNEAEKEYLGAAIRKIASYDIQIINTKPYAMSQEEIGDSIFHLSHDYRDTYTLQFAKALKPLL